MSSKESWFWRGLLTFLLGYVITMLAITPAPAHDEGQWENQDPAITEWYRNLMRPDEPTSSCCGEADAYWCDDIHVNNNKTFCTITDDRLDAPRHRPHIDVGTVIEILPGKLKWDRSNPTGHSILFMSRGGHVYCFVQGTGT